jgi:hypothetical protein
MGMDIKDLIWLWFFFGLGSAVYVLKRAYYLVTGPNPVANNYTEFFKRCWIPLLVRQALDSGLYWLTFYPDMFNWVVNKVGYQIHSPIPHYAVVAFFFGMGIDSMVDFLVSKIPWVKDWLPQMPPPLPKAPIGGQP